MSARIPLGPVDQEGVRHDRPPSQVRWTELTNFVIQEGRLVSRPGFRVDNWGGANDVPSVQPAPIVALAEIFNPGSSATGRESYSPVAETLVPNALTDLVAGWSGAVTAIDEGTPGGDNITTGTQGAATIIDFGATSGTYSVVLGVVIHGRARINNTGAWAKLNFYQRVSGTNYLIGSRIITTREEAEGDDWEDFYLTLSKNLNNNRPLDSTDIDNLQIVMELDSSESIQAETILADGDGTHTEWLDAQDGGTAAFGDCKGGPDTIIPFDESTLPTNRWIRSNGAGTRQSFTFTPALTYASIDNISVGGYFRKPGGRDLDAELQVTYWNGSGTEFALSTITSLAGQPGRIFSADSQTNPDTSAAWVAADITGGEFGVEFISGTQLAGGTFSMTLYGTKTGGVDVEVDVINLQVMGVNHNTQSRFDRDRIFSSNLWHNRYDDDHTQPTITDVTNSVPLDSTGPGWPVSHAVLYGQVFMVNGKDPTVYYPDGSNTFSEFTANNADGATKLTGRVTAAFGDRLWYGWITDNTTVTPERLAYSQWKDASTHNHRSAGDFDLLDTPGGVMAMVPLDEQLMAVIKEVGAYVIRRTGNDIFPFIRDMIDPFVEIIGGLTAKQVQFSEGPAIVFLGTHPTYGLNVYAFDGASVSPIGNAIARKLREDLNLGTAVLSAHAQVDPQTNTYWLFIPEGDDSWPTVAWVMNLTTGQWTRAEFPFSIFSSGTWNFPDSSWLNFASDVKSIGGRSKMVLGSGAQYLPLAADVDAGYDEMVHTSTDVGVTGEDVRIAWEQGQRWKTFTPKMTTGDLVKPADMEVMSYRIGIVYKARDPINRVLVDQSIDGGKTFDTTNAKEFWFGPQDDQNNDVRAPVGGIYYAEFDMEPTHAAQVRYRLRFKSPDETYDGTNNLDEFTLPQRVEIHDAWVTVESGADSE